MRAVPGRESGLLLLPGVEQAAKAVRAQAELLDDFGLAVIAAHPSGVVVHWNAAAEQMYGWSSAEALGRMVGDLVTTEETAENAVEESGGIFGFLPRGQSWSGELWVRCRGGRRLPVSVTEKPVLDQHGRLVAIIGVAVDLSKRTKQACRLESIGTLASGLAHDLNNALTPVMIATDGLGSQETDPSRLGKLHTIASGVQRAQEMVRQILSSVSGVEGRRMTVDIGSVLRDVERAANHTFLGTIRIVLEDASDVCPVSADPTQLDQVLTNLCLNARDAMPRGGTLVLAADVVDLDEENARRSNGATPGRYVRIRVEDDGDGMSADVLDRIFEPFYTTKAHGHGTGLGLWNSVCIIRSHGGFMTVESAPGRGTRFLVHLPAAADDAAPKPEPTVSAAPVGDGQLVLVVDDEEHIRAALRSVLTASGYEVLEASDGAGAVSAFASAGSTVDLVLTDLTMPDVDGLEVIRALRHICPDVPVVLTSGVHTEMLIAQAAELGIRHVLSKPFTVSTLLHMVRDVLGEQR